MATNTWPRFLPVRSTRIRASTSLQRLCDAAEGLDRDHEQLVLLVQEPERVFLEPVSKHRARIDRSKVKVVREDDLNAWIERRTSARKRHFLCGRDERQLFVCQLPRPVTTVRSAHEVLRAPAAVQSKRDGVRWID